jgi:photosystem II stability/assembly factor-like uncharacterized protein
MLWTSFIKITIMKKPILLFCLLMISILVFPQWVQQTSNTTRMLRSICFTNENTGIVVGDHGTILKTTDGGVIWSSISSGTVNDLNSVDFPNADTGFAVGDSGTIIKTIDGGASWTSIAPFPFWEIFYCVKFPDENKGWVTDSEGDVFKTYDGGLTWYTIPDLITAPIYSACFTDTTFGYLVGGGNGDEKGFIIKAGEDIWTILPENRTVLYSVFFPNDSTGYAAGIYGTVVKTNDAGHTWNILQHDNGPFYYSVFFTDKNTGYVAGADGIIKKTTDGGLNWTVSPSGITEELRGITFLNADTGYAVGRNGTILKTNTGGFVSIENQVPEEPAFTVYPNPANDKIIIILGKKSSERFILTITDLMGIQKMHRELQNQIQYELDVSSYCEGVYLIKLQTKSGFECIKLLIK